MSYMAELQKLVHMTTSSAAFTVFICSSAGMIIVRAKFTNAGEVRLTATLQLFGDVLVRKFGSSSP